jgi:hypothetical protein
MSENPEQETFTDALRDAAAVFEAPDTERLLGVAVRRGRQIRRRRAGVAAAGGTVARGTAGVLAFTLSVAAGHGTAAARAAGSSAR